MHLDIPYFWHATRYAFPQWLLLVMQDSGLFAVQRLPQVQALVYVHDWRVDNMTDPEQFKRFGGEFVIYPSGPSYPPKVYPATPRSAIFCDGSEVVHGTSTFRPEIEPHPFDKDKPSVMRWDGQESVWRLFEGEQPTEIAYSWQEVRASIAYRGWCFSDKEVMDHWDATEWSGDWELEDVMAILQRDLVNERKAISLEKWKQMDPYDQAMLLMKTYIQLPRPVMSKIGYNYCLYFAVLPDLGGLTQMVESLFC